MARPVMEIPAEEADVYAWAQDYVARQKQAGQRPSRAAITRAVQSRFGQQSGRQLGVLTWVRIMFWVVWILMMLA